MVLVAAVAVASVAWGERGRRRGRLCPSWTQSEVCCFDRCPRVCDTCPYTACHLRCVKRYDPETWDWLFPKKER
jgi:hypothetical protein